ncbi:MAG: o-succinylbenzoate--CoA ligase [Aeromicrobium sp.]|uniref:AMP-binding protein n=1 Tax=Aeromicrobium sp. TaxID=1871063 RepID=UPI00260F6C8E|nr:AMP-binding protein [Aeromicrobium sp.]MCW2824999.1 o-succinylbenzoate--CoA ligase [Aeromicrobium sp.]
MWGTLPDVLDRACGYYRDSDAIVDGDRRLTYGALQDLSDRIGNGLVSLGVQKGERVGLLLPNSLEFIPCQHGIWKAGAVLVQMPTRASASVQCANLDQTAATTLIYHATFDDVVAAMRDQLPKIERFIRVGGAEGDHADVRFQELVDAQPTGRPDVDIDVDDESYVLFTSGSTGEPKGVVQSHFTWGHYSITAGLEIADIRFGEVFAHGAPLTHFTQIFVMPTFLRGGTNVMLPGLEVDGLLAAIQKEGITATAVVPTIVYLMLDHPHLDDYDLSTLATMVYAGSPIAPERLRQALEVFGPIFIQTYAGTEPGYVSCMRKGDHRADTEQDLLRLASAGRPMFQVEVSIQDDDDRILPIGEVGEVCSRQLGQMLGYVDASRNAEAIRNGWVHTGDIGRLDDDGYLFIVDRKKDLVVSGGFNVFPRQVEDVLVTHEAVAQAAVIGVPHDKWGEAVHAFVVRKPGHDVSDSELMAHVKAELGAIPSPKAIEFLGELPANPAGKVDKKILRRPFWEGRDRQVG